LVRGRLTAIGTDAEKDSWSQWGKHLTKIKAVKIHHHGGKGNILKTSSGTTDTFISFSLESRENTSE